jgi:putative ABC transport system substrate-binding protein
VLERRDFIALLGGAGLLLAAKVKRARAQQPRAVPVIGFLSSVSAGASAGMTLGFRRGFAETGYVEGQNIAVEYRWAEGRYDRLPALASALNTASCPCSKIVCGQLSGKSVSSR